MKKRLFYVLFAIALMLTSLISGCAGVGRIGSFFTNNEYKQYAKIIDFGLFFVIFFALCYLGFTKVWGEGFGKPGSARGAVIGLSLALSLALTFAIVTQTKFSITTIFPLAQAIFFLVIWFLLWGLLDKTKVLGEGYLAKIGYAIITFMFAYIVFSMLTHMICQMSDNMDDAACKSDFFNAGYTVLSRFFGGVGTSGGGGLGSGGGTSGGGGGTAGGKTGTGTSTGGGTGGGTGGTTPGGTTATGPIQGGCRLDITFEYNSDSTLTSGAPITDFVQKVKAMGVNKVHVYGYASKEGEANLNWGLAGRRAGTIASRIRSADPSISVSDSSKGATTIFDAGSYPPNRRVVIFTDSLSSVLPAPAAGTVYGCTPTKPSALCGNGIVDTGESCDTKNTNSCPAGQKCKADCSGCEPSGGSGTGGGMPWWGWLIIGILLFFIILLLGKKNRMHPNIKDRLAMKDKYLQDLTRIQSQKKIAHSSIAIVDPSTMGDSEVKAKAKQLIDSLENELRTKGWKPIQQLAKDYAKNFDKIVPNSKAFKIDEQHAKLIVKLLKALRAKHAPKDKFFAKLWDKATFDYHLVEVTSEIIDKNKATNEYHNFFRLQLNLKRATEIFKNNEEKILVEYREMHYTTLFGKKNFLTRHIFRKKGFPWLTMKQEEEGKLVEDLAKGSTTYGIVEVTQEVKNLCEELLALITEVMDAEDNVTHFPDAAKLDLNTKFDKENELIDELMAAIRIQKKIMSEDWHPVINKISGEEMHGHIHYERKLKP